MDQSNRVGSQPTGPAAEQTKETVKAAATDVAETAKSQIRDVAGEVKQQGRNVAAQVRDGVTEQARVQQDNLAQTVRRVADELEAMADQRPDSPAATVVARVADGGHQVAQYLADRGPEGLLAEVQDFARRRPGAFLATALVSGFVIGRLGRGVIGAASSPPADNPRTPMSPFADDTSPLGSMAAEEDTLVYSTASADRVPVSGEFR
jgi:hypothetical protein